MQLVSRSRSTAEPPRFMNVFILNGLVRTGPECEFSFCLLSVMTNDTAGAEFVVILDGL